MTGASGGIGQAIARRLSADGAAVLVHYNSRGEEAEALATELTAGDQSAVAAQADLTRPEAVASLFALAEERLGSIDIVVANAGVPSPRLPLAEVSDEAFNRAFDGNTRATFLVVREAARCVRNDGRIIIIGSSTTIHPAAGFSAYAASKAPSLVLTPILAAELAPRGITVNLVAAGPDRRWVSRPLVARRQSSTCGGQPVRSTRHCPGYGRCSGISRQ